MSDNTQTAADGISMEVSRQLVMETLEGKHDEKIALLAIGCEKPWWSQFVVGGFVNLVDLDESHPIKSTFGSTVFTVIYPEGISLSTDPEDPEHTDAIKAFNKAVKKASKGVENAAKVFAKKSYSEALLIAQAGYFQVHCSITVGEVKFGIHAWTNLRGEVRGDEMMVLAKVKIDKDTQLEVINEYL